MSKIGLIIQREYTTRARKKSFLVISILGPLLFGGLIFIPALLVTNKNENQRIVLVDYTKSFCGTFTDNATVHFDYGYCSIDSNEVKKIFADSAHASVMVIPKIEHLMQVQLYSKDDPGDDVVSAIESQINSMMEIANMKANNLDPKIINGVKSNIRILNRIGKDNKLSNSSYNAGLGYACSFLIYIFIFLYSVQVMRGVMEEKINRVVEVIISSVRPFQLMMGKVIGVGLVGLTQFLIWVILGYGTYAVGSSYFQAQQINPKNATISQTYKTGMPVQNNNVFNGNKIGTKDVATAFDGVDNMLRSTNWILIIGGFLFYFLGGYMLYSALFAAVGSAVDQETDTQQFMLPVTMPLILSIVVMGSIITNPHSTIAVWFSIIPFTAPVAMMARLPFGIPIWQLALSMVMLVASIFGTVWLAGRIYRVGLLMYGKKVTYKELGKWLFYK
ncbi:MAG TPA: ABC transporter permease [Bacteroidia bacterium]|nr:ABC transporter permease [Bacteroidia bacterium]